MAGSEIGDFLGWCLAFLLLGLVVLGPLRRNQGAARAYLVTTVLHVVAAAIYVYVPGVLPSRDDSHAFHKYAVERLWAEEWSFGISSQLYKECLAYIYSLVGPSYFLGAILSIYAFALSVIVLVKLMELLRVQQGQGLVVLLFGALPTAVLYGSVPMREPYEVLFLMAACYSMLRFRLSSQPLHLVAGFIFALMMGLLHKGLIVYAPFLIVMMLLVRVDTTLAAPNASLARGTYFHRVVGLALAAVFVGALPAAVPQIEAIRGAETLGAAAEGRLIDFAEEHRDDEALTMDRTAYGIALNTSSPGAFVASLSAIFLYYLFTPFPWQVRNLLDVYAFGEVVLRVALLAAIFRAWRRREPLPAQTVLMVVYLSMALLWAVGTTNYGTATRHHMTHQWIILLLGVPALLNRMPAFTRARVDGRHTVTRMREERAEMLQRRPHPSAPAARDSSCGAAPALRPSARAPRRLEVAGAPQRLTPAVGARGLQT